MVPVLLIICAGVPLLSVFAHTTRAGLLLASSSIGNIRSRLMRFATIVGLTAVSIGVAVPVILLTLAHLPDFRSAGDGGIGMAYNVICRIATVLQIPAVICFLVGRFLFWVTPRRSPPEDALNLSHGSKKGR